MNSVSSYQPTESDTSQYLDLEFPYERGIDNVTLAGAKDVSEYVTKYRIAYETAPGAFYQYVFNEEGAIYVCVFSLLCVMLLICFWQNTH